MSSLKSEEEEELEDILIREEGNSGELRMSEREGGWQQGWRSGADS